MHRCSLLLLLAIVGCTSTPDPAPEPQPTPPAGGALVEWSVRPADADVAAFREKVVAFRDSPACLWALWRWAPDLGHVVALEEQDDALRGNFAHASSSRLLSAKGTGGRDIPSGDYVAAEAARSTQDTELGARHRTGRERLARAWSRVRTAPAEAEVDARDAVGDFEAQDTMRWEEAGLLADSLSRERVSDGTWSPPHSTTVLEAQALLIKLSSLLPPFTFDEVAERVMALRHFAVLERMEALRESGALRQGPGQLHDWLVILARAALDRGQALPALRHATAAARAGEALPDALGRARDRVLVARANVLGARDEAGTLGLLADAAETAAQVREAAPGPRAIEAAAVVADARALAGEVLLRRGRAEDAAEAFGEAAALFAEAGDEVGRYRQALNQVTAWTKLGKHAEAEAALSALGAAPSPPSLHGRPELHEGGATRDEVAAELDARRAITAALLGNRKGALTLEAAAVRVEEALRAARDAGAWRVCEQYGPLPASLRTARR